MSAFCPFHWSFDIGHSEGETEMELTTTQSNPVPLPEPRVSIAIRAGTVEDIPFLDALQKKTTKQVGWMPTKQFEGKVNAGHVLVAEGVTSNETRVTSEDLVTRYASLVTRAPVGYLIGNDQYFKRDDVGIIYQINVIPEMRRSLVAASLLKAQFERSAYGCRLYCCWCAQDIEANQFWEAMGFVPLAFRAGSRTKGAGGGARVHIFWQKRIRAGDVSTPWWFPSKTDGGAIREDRIVLPIPPGTHWSDAKPLILPGSEVDETKLIEETRERRVGKSASRKEKSSSATRRLDDLPKAAKRVMQFGPPGMVLPVVEEATPEPTPAPVKPKRQKKKCDPTFVAAARELRDRYLDEVNAGRHLVEPVAAKYEVGRMIEGASTTRRLGDLPMAA